MIISRFYDYIWHINIYLLIFTYITKFDHKKMQSIQSKSRIAPCQLIDEHKNFTRDAVDNISKMLPNVEKQYYSVAIIGVQNSGKSTLLNYLFGTDFDVLHAVAGTRTTRGILTSLDKEENLIILDVQGNDSMDRTQDPEYEKMVASFALASADVLIINIKSMSLGQYSGSQYETLTKILQICIDQFKQQSPKTILFCVRDFNDETDEEGEVRRKIIRDVNNIWAKIEKPKQFEKYQNSPQKFFTIQVAVFHRYMNANSKQFFEDVKKLRCRFTNHSQPTSLFAKKKTTFNLPLQDLSQLMLNSWQSIKHNKKLNLPNEKQQLSNFRCSDVLSSITHQFKAQIQMIQKAKKPEDLGMVFEKFRREFETQTYNYGRHIIQEKEKTLLLQMRDTIVRVTNVILEHQQQQIRQSFGNNARLFNRENSLKLSQALGHLKNQSVQQYSHVFKTFNYQLDTRKQKIQRLNLSLTKQIQQVKAKIISDLKADFQKEYSRSMRLLSSQVLKQHFGKNFWTRVNQIYSDKRDLLIQDYKQKIEWAQNKALQGSAIDQLDQKMSVELKKTIRDELQRTLTNRAYQIFSLKFTRSEQGTLYNFNILQQEKIAQKYDQSRDFARQIIMLINLYNVKRSRQSSIFVQELQTQFGQDQDQFFDTIWLSNALGELDRKMIHQYQTVVRRKKQGEMKKVPIWLFVVILYFVYDDIWFSSEDYPLTNFVLTIFLIFVAFFFAIGQQSACLQLWNLVLQYISLAGELVRKKLGR